MKVTKVVANSVSPQERGVCGEFTITLDDSLCIHRLLVVNGEKGLFVTFPNIGRMRCSGPTKRYLDVVHPTDNTLRQHIQNEVLSRYLQEVDKIST